MRRDDFQERVVSLHSDGFDIHVHRRRDSNGKGSITLVMHYPDAKGGGIVEIEFNNDRYGDDYALKARELADLLGRACDEACEIAPPSTAGTKRG